MRDRQEQAPSTPREAPTEPGLRPEVARLLDAVHDRRDAGHLVDAIVAAAQSHLGMEVAFLSRFTPDEQQYVAAAGPADTFGVAPGGAAPLAETYCARMVRGELPFVIPDAAGDPRVNHLPVTSDRAIGAYVGVPVRLADGEAYGSLCCMSHEAHPEIDDRDVDFLRVLAAVIAGELDRDADRSDRRRAAAEGIAAALRRGELDICFQPIVRLKDGEVVGVEALTRFEGRPPSRPPDSWFADAWEMGAGLDLELVAVRSALAAARDVPDTVYLAVNVDPRTAVTPRFATALAARADGRRMMVELTEHALVRGYAPLRAAMLRLRRGNVRFAIDDVGAGYAGLSHIVQLAPDAIKLDRALIGGLAQDAARRALVTAAVAFAGGTGVRLIAEGVEQESDLEALRELGVGYVQGFLLGRPGPLEAALAARVA
jgi:EAL domain-containing protein (putative c-di-GMP-specific phosphodiesterase class I)